MLARESLPDDVAYRLARTLHAERLVVVKSCPIDRQQSFEELTAAGVLDARFAQWAHDAPFPIELVERQQVSELRDALVLGNLPGTYQ